MGFSDFAGADQLFVLMYRKTNASRRGLDSPVAARPLMLRYLSMSGLVGASIDF
jgi:hypothetical protein